MLSGAVSYWSTVGVAGGTIADVSALFVWATTIWASLVKLGCCIGTIAMDVLVSSGLLYGALGIKHRLLGSGRLLLNIRKAMKQWYLLLIASSKAITACRCTHSLVFCDYYDPSHVTFIFEYVTDCISFMLLYHWTHLLDGVCFYKKPIKGLIVT